MTTITLHTPQPACGEPLSHALVYRGHHICRGRTYQDWFVDFPGRRRWGTLAECRQDVDDYLAGTLPPKKGGL